MASIWKLGICASGESATYLAESGADFIELGVVRSLNPRLDDTAWEPELTRLQSLPIPRESFNLFLPADLRITGASEQLADPKIVERYVFQAFRRAQKIGGALIVFGSGGARRVPEDFPRDQAVEQIQMFLKVCARATEDTGVVLAIEPLNRGECNIINSVREAVDEYAVPIAHPGIRVLADTFHMEKESEPISVIRDCHSFIAHIHTADTNREPPGKGSYDHVALFHILKEIGYKGRVCAEANYKDMATEAASSLAHLRSAAESVY